MHILENSLLKNLQNLFENSNIFFRGSLLQYFNILRKLWDNDCFENFGIFTAGCKSILWVLGVEALEGGGVVHGKSKAIFGWEASDEELIFWHGSINDIN